jgi:hypothetical protein
MTYIHTTSNSFGWVSINTRASARFGSTFEHATEPLNFIFLLQASTDTEKGANDYNKHYDARHYALDDKYMHIDQSVNFNWRLNINFLFVKQHNY